MSIDLSTKYLGLELRNPLVVAACPLTGDLESLHQLEASGAAAAVLPSLFEEQIEHDQWAVHHMHEFHAESFAESLDYFPDLDEYNTGPETYLSHIRAAQEALHIPPGTLRRSKRVRAFQLYESTRFLQREVHMIGAGVSAWVENALAVWPSRIAARRP